MKIRSTFVSNSSSSSFIIKNLSDNNMSVLDFARENIHLLQDFNDEYNDNISEDSFLGSASSDGRIIPAGESMELDFGDEDGTVIGRVFDYILREGGESENFRWSYYRSLR